MTGPWDPLAFDGAVIATMLERQGAQHAGHKFIINMDSHSAWWDRLRAPPHAKQYTRGKAQDYAHIHASNRPQVTGSHEDAHAGLMAGALPQCVGTRLIYKTHVRGAPREWWAQSTFWEGGSFT